MNNLMFLMFPNPLPILLLLPLCGWLEIKYPSKRTRAMLLMTLMVVPISLVVINTIKQLSPLAPYKFDQFFYMIDLNLGDPSYRLAVFLNDHPLLHRLLEVVYNLLPYELVAVFAMYAWEDSLAEAWRSVWATVLLYTLILPLYFLFPAVGPAGAFPGFPYIHPHIIVPQYMVVSGAPNCMPSGHFAMALLTIWLARKWKWGIVLASVFALLTAVATLGLGEHYTIDLMASIPYTALIIYLVKPIQAKSSEEWIGVANDPIRCTTVSRVQ